MLAACGSPPGRRSASRPIRSLLPTTIGPVTFACDDGSAIEATFDNAPDPATVRLVRGDQTFTLPQAMSGSGARYVGDGIEFWNKGRDVRMVELAGHRSLDVREPTAAPIDRGIAATSLPPRRESSSGRASASDVSVAMSHLRRSLASERIDRRHPSGAVRAAESGLQMIIAVASPCDRRSANQDHADRRPRCHAPEAPERARG